jgi:hypothetical protein
MEMNPDERHRRIAEAAYFRAEQHGFRMGAELDDWLEAEREIDTVLSGLRGAASNDETKSRGGPENDEQEAIAPPST